tara:strand:+ start:116 stop:730 length:615 start_codon:yes stop_codon:yes gene_type:complete
MNLIIFGPPGIGKGTTSSRLSKKLKIPHIATGDILREEAKKPGNKLKRFMDKGLLVPDQIVSDTILKKISSKECKNGYILDGFPRTLNQAQFLKDSNVKFNHIINLSAPNKVIIQRLTGRLICPKDNQIYHIENLPPKKPGICDICNSPLIQRKDDTPDVIKERLEVYKKNTKPILQYYKNLVIDIDASLELDKILENIITAIK